MNICLPQYQALLMLQNQKAKCNAKSQILLRKETSRAQIPCRNGHMQLAQLHFIPFQSFFTTCMAQATTSYNITLATTP